MRIPVIRPWPTWTPLLPWTFRNLYRLFLQPAKHGRWGYKNTPYDCQNAVSPCTPPTLFTEHARASTRSVVVNDDNGGGDGGRGGNGGVRWIGILTIFYRFEYGCRREKKRNEQRR